MPGTGTAKHLGLPLEEIAELLSVRESAACREVKADLLPRIAARLQAAEERAAEFAALAATLHASPEHLGGLPDRSGRCDPLCGFLAPARPTTGQRTVSRLDGHRVDMAFTPGRRVAEEAAAERWRTAPVACSLTGEETTERIAAWHRALAGARRHEIPDGLRLTLPVNRTQTVAGLAAAEQGCCGFFDFRLHLDGPDLHLEVRAQAEGAGLLAELFADAT